MRAAALLVLLSVLVAVAPFATATPATDPSGHYLPQPGDGFHYYETWAIVQGTGSYSGYSGTQFVNGSIGVTAVAANGTDAATYANTDTWIDSTGAYYGWASSGTFTFSAATFLYVDGTDNQTGYVDPSVWFYINNSLPVGGSLTLLNTPSTVRETNYTQTAVASSTGFALTTWTQGNGSYQTSSGGETWTATYTWNSFFDAATGYILSYVYIEHDVSQAGSYEVVDALQVTSATFPISSVSSGASGSSSSSGNTSDLLVVAIVVVVVVVVVVAILASRARRSRLPRHSAGGNLGFGPAPPPMGVPPPVHLTPSGQPAVQQIVIRETVKVPCRYCGTLMDSTATVCPSCGAPRT